MNSSVTSCSGWQLYVIADRAAIGNSDLIQVVRGATRGGADAIQLRDKHGTDAEVADASRKLLPITRAAGIPLLINDRVEVALAVGADGVHLGQHDRPLAEARDLLGPGRILGKSTHSFAQATAAVAEGADYIAVGPIYSTPTKPTYPHVGVELIIRVAAHVRLPIVCIGGLDAENLQAAIAAGGRCVAVVRAVCAAADPEAATRALKQTLAHALHPHINPTART